MRNKLGDLKTSMFTGKGPSTVGIPQRDINRFEKFKLTRHYTAIIRNRSSNFS